MKDLVIYCLSIRPTYYKELCESVRPFKVVFVDGHSPGSYARVCNNIIKGSIGDYVLLSNDKARPKEDDVLKMIDLFNKGFGFVGLYRMGFFGVHKSVLNKVGLLDERFVDGGYEDNDYYIRLKQHNVATYITEEINYIANKHTLWPQKQSAIFFSKKYKIDHAQKIFYKNISDDMFSHKFSIDNEFTNLPWSDSVLGPIPLVSYEAHFEIMLRDYNIIDVSRGVLNNV